MWCTAKNPGGRKWEVLYFLYADDAVMKTESELGKTVGFCDDVWW